MKIEPVPVLASAYIKNFHPFPNAVTTCVGMEEGEENVCCVTMRALLIIMFGAECSFYNIVCK